MFSVIFPPTIIGLLTSIVLIAWMIAAFLLLSPAVLL